MDTSSENKNTESESVQTDDLDEGALKREDLDSVSGGHDDLDQIAYYVGYAAGEVYDHLGGGGDGFGE